MSDDHKPADIISLAAFRDRGVIAECPPEWVRVAATGADEIELEIHADGIEGQCWLMTRAGAENLIRQIKAELRAARHWDADRCRACGEPGCFDWHVGQIVERNRQRYSYEGTTPAGRRKMRAMSTGKLQYTRALYPAHFGRIVGWVDIVPAEDS